jgi:diguanylate cyclase (GGDEF)-like protein
MATVAPEGATLPFDGLPGRLESAFLVPAIDNKRAFGAMVLFYEGEPPAEPLTRAQTLARHLGLALRNLGKFAEVEDLVYLDDLTHLFNHRYIQQVLDKELKVATTTQGAKPFTVLFMDLDYFKSVNDTHGHAVGSKLLVEVARVVKGCVRDNDVVCRWGGDEYVVLLRGTDSGGALKVAERIRRSIESHHFLAREGFGLSITTSIGMASFPEHAQSKSDLLDFSDRAMYRGKKGSRNIIYMASKGLDPTPASRHNTQPPPDAPAKT